MSTTHRYVPFLFCLASILLSACNTPKDNDFRDQFRWISGKWKGEYDGRTVIEQWSWEKHRFEGTSIEIEKGDTVLNETLFLEEHAGHSSYIAVLTERDPILFSGSHNISSNKWVFQNPEHDFPAQLVYQLLGDSALNISVHGPDGNGFSYQLVRTK